MSVSHRLKHGLKLRPDEPTAATVEDGARRINPMLARVIAQLREYGNVPQVTLPTYNRAVRTTAPAKLAVPVYSEMPEVSIKLLVSDLPTILRLFRLNTRL